MDGKTPWDKLSSEIHPLQFTNFHCFEQESVLHFKHNFYSEYFGFCFLASIIFIFFLPAQIMILKFVFGLLLIIYLFTHNTQALLFD